MPTLHRRALLACAASLVALCAAPAMVESNWPDKSIRFIVPYTPGGATDAVTRLIAQKISEDTKWVFVVDNRAGGNGNIGLDVVAKARPDGYTIGMGQTANLAVNPSLFAKMPYDALKDVAPVSIVASQPVVLVVRADAPFKTLADVVAAATGGLLAGAFAESLVGIGLHARRTHFAHLGRQADHALLEFLLQALGERLILLAPLRQLAEYEAAFESAKTHADRLSIGIEASALPS